MNSGNDLITLTCPKCRNQIEESMVWLQANPVFVHPVCRAVLEFDHDNYLRRVAGEAIEGQADLSLRLVAR